MIDIYELLRRDQDGTSEYVREKLDEMKIPYEVDDYGNIFYLENKERPLLSAHMDTVRKEADFCIGAFLNESDDDKIFSGGILGGDDKCGVYIILKVLEAGRVVNFIFSRDEEIGCLGIKALLKPNYQENKEKADKVRDCLWCLVLDRRNNSDIICFQNGYGSIEFEKALEKVSKDGNFGYVGARGLCSDADTIEEFISTANISVGYYSPHSAKEYISKKDLEKALNYTIAVIDNIKEKFAPSETKTFSYSYNGYHGGYYNAYDYYDTYYSGYDFPGYDDDDWDGWNDWETKAGVHKCSFCHTHAPSEQLIDITMPDGRVKSICSFCLQDLEDEIKRVRAKSFNLL